MPPWQAAAMAAPCPADLTTFLDRFQSADPAADLAEPFGVLNFFDLQAYLSAFTAGCG